MIWFPSVLCVSIISISVAFLQYKPGRVISWSSVKINKRMMKMEAINDVDIKTKKTLFDKIWDSHLVDNKDANFLLYIDRHLVHEVTSPQAFEGLKINNRAIRRPDCTLVTVDHNVPTTDRSTYSNNPEVFIQEPASRLQVLTLEENVRKFGLTYFGMNDTRQGIVHIIGPEQGFTLPGSTIVCGDSHTATHGAFGALAFGIGTSEVEHVLATQTLVQSSKPKNMRITVDGLLNAGVTSKDLILHIIGVIGTAGGTGYVIEFAGSAIRNLSVEARMSMCNMAIEAGARAGMIASDDKTFEYLSQKPMVPKGELFLKAVEYWRTLVSDEGALFDKELTIHVDDVAPTVSWGTSPQDVAPITGVVPDPDQLLPTQAERAKSMKRSLEYMGLSPTTPLDGIKVDKVFIGSCTNARIEDLREAASVVQAFQQKLIHEQSIEENTAKPQVRVAEHVHAMVVPGSGLVKMQAELEGLHDIFIAAGFDWREPGCSMCLAMNPDKLEPGERCASTSNRNFEGRQGTGGRTHLLSPAMAAAAAITGTITDVRTVLKKYPSTSISDHSLTDEDALVWRKKFDELTSIARQQRYQLRQSTSDNKVDTMDIDATLSSKSINAFEKVESIAAKIDIQNIDTDMIIPKQFLKTIKRSGLGKHLFHELRYIVDSKTNHVEERSEFILNQEVYREAKILIVGDNFGCGSSREHAPWALRDFGIRCIISTSFADIFYNNCFKNGILPIKLSQEKVRDLMVDADHQRSVVVDLSEQEIIRSDGRKITFPIDAFRKHCLLHGLDDIGLTMQRLDKIAMFEKERSRLYPWLDNATCLYKE